jgi:hypothetical protein
LVGLKKNVMCIFITTVLLILRCYRHRYLSCFYEVTEHPIKAVGMNRILGLFVSLAHQIVQQLLNQILLTLICRHHLEHLWNKIFTRLLI